MGKIEQGCDCDLIHSELVLEAKKKMLGEDILLSVADFYKVLSDSTRIKIVNLLDESELCVCDIAYILNMTKSAVSHQLKNLKDMKLVKSRRHGREIFYSLKDAHVKQVFEISIEHIMESYSEN